MLKTNNNNDNNNNNDDDNNNNNNNNNMYEIKQGFVLRITGISKGGFSMKNIRRTLEEHKAETTCV